MPNLEPKREFDGDGIKVTCSFDIDAEDITAWQAGTDDTAIITHDDAKEIAETLVRRRIEHGSKTIRKTDGLGLGDFVVNGTEEY